MSVKDLFDVKGFITKAGTQFMKFDEPAAKDCDVIARLREAGAVFIGHTNMTELAYSGLGLNPHYGTPVNALYLNVVRFDIKFRFRKFIVYILNSAFKVRIDLLLISELL